MGYFKRRIRPKAAAREWGQILEAGRWIDPSAWSAAPSEQPPASKGLFIRLAVEERHRESQQPSGIFSAAYDLLDGEDVSASDAQRLRRTLRWFKANLIVPRNVPPRAVFWFKSEAEECLFQVWRLVDVLRSTRRVVKMMSSTAPGRIVNQDAQQVAAIEFYDRSHELNDLPETRQLAPPHE